MPSDTTPLGEYVSLQRGTTYKSRLLGEPGPYLLGLASIAKEGGFRTDKLKTYGGDSPEKLVLRPGDLYVSLKDVAQAGHLLGSIARVSTEVREGRLTQDTVGLTRLPGSPPGSYLYWILRTPQYRAYCRSRAIGTTNLSLRREDFLGYPIPDPTDSRLAVVELLGALDDRIEVNRRMNRTLEAMAQALFRRRFVDFDGRDDLVDTEAGPLPSGWRWGRLSDLSDLNPTKWTKRIAPEEIHYLTLTDVSWGEYGEAERMLYAEAPSRARRTLRDGDTIFGQVRPGNGSYTMIQHPAPNLTGSTGFVVLRPKTDDARHYVYLSVTQPETVEYFAAVADGSAYPAVAPDIVHGLEVPVPPADELAEFDAQVAPLYRRVSANRSHSRTLAALRDAFLPKLVSGEIRVPEAEAAVEEVV